MKSVSINIKILIFVQELKIVEVEGTDVKVTDISRRIIKITQSKKTSTKIVVREFKENFTFSETIASTTVHRCMDGLK